MARNKSEKPDAWVAELIAFAHLCEKQLFQNAEADGFPLRTARTALSPEARARFNPKQHMWWRQIADNIFETYGRGNATQSK